MLMKRLVALAVLIALLSGCAHVENVKPHAAYVDVSVEEAYRLIEEHRGDSSFVILDVRGGEDFKKEHIAGAINLDVFDRGFEEKLKRMDTNKTYLVYCKTGFRSKIAAGIMAKMGFRHVYNMAGGVEAWKSMGYPVEKTG